MTPRVATIVRCADSLADVYSTIASIDRQTTGRGEVVLATGDTTPEKAREWLTELARARQLVVAHAAGAAPGAGRNAAVRLATSDLVVLVDAGDRLDPQCHDTLVAAVDGQGNSAWAASGIHLLGPGSRSLILSPSACDLTAVVAGTDALPGATIFRREVWAALGGFDESLAALEEYDFWLRLLQAGARCVAVDRPLLIRRMRPGGLYRRALDPLKHQEAVARIVEKHAALFTVDPAAALCQREERLGELGERYRRALNLRDEGLRMLGELKLAASELGRRLPVADRASVDMGDLWRTTPVARDWGYERGRPVDRHYIEAFLERSAADIRGAVLEVQEPEYTSRFGGARVVSSDVVDVNPANPRATIVSDLRCAANIAADTYDCIILTQTLHVIDDMPAVLAECRRILAPGGVLLVTLPAASRVCLEYGDEGDFWRVTEAGARRLFGQVFGEDQLEVQAHGNVLVTTAFLYGLSCDELTPEQFGASDPYFPLLVTIRARKHAGPPRSGRAGGEGEPQILLYHRVASVDSDVHGLSIPAEVFREQMAALRDRFNPMPLGELVAAARQGAMPPRAIAVTFDDGYVDNFTTASPILQEFGVPATFFITTERLGDAYGFWWDALERALLIGADRDPFASELQLALPGGHAKFRTTTAAERASAHAAIYDAIVGSPAEAREAVVREVGRWRCGSRERRDPQARRMTPAEIVELARRPGHAIGAHTVQHLMLPRQSGAVQREEISGSRVALETLIGAPVTAFAYPFGAYSPETVAEVGRAGFEIAMTCDEHALSAADHPLQLPRVMVGRTMPSALTDF